jgi:hypothetical protein
MVKRDSTMISPSIMFRKGNKNIPKSMRAILNQLISIMISVKANKSLAKGARLYWSEANPNLDSQELSQHITDDIKVYLMLRERVNSSDGEVQVTSTWPSQNDSRHRPASRNRHSIVASGNERCWIDELEGHVAARRAFRGRVMAVERDRAAVFWVGGVRGARM